MIEFCATDAWYKKAAESEEDIDEISAGLSIFIPEEAYKIILNIEDEKREVEVSFQSFKLR